MHPHIHQLLPARLISALAGFTASITTPWFKNAFIRQFIRAYGVNMQEALHVRAEDYRNFNDFFTRKLRTGARPIADGTWCSPVDGCISAAGSITDGMLLQAKGQYYSVAELLGCTAEEAKTFQNGQFATFYLSPKDYHRVHSPISGVIRSLRYIPGKLFSVQPMTVAAIPKLFARNERAVVEIETPEGRVMFVFVGAIIVGAIGISWRGLLARKNGPFYEQYAKVPKYTIQKGEELGLFQLGSTVIMLTESDFKKPFDGKAIVDKPVRMGESLKVG